MYTSLFIVCSQTSGAWLQLLPDHSMREKCAHGGYLVVVDEVCGRAGPLLVLEDVDRAVAVLEQHAFAQGVVETVPHASNERQHVLNVHVGVGREQEHHALAQWRVLVVPQRAHQALEANDVEERMVWWWRIVCAPISFHMTLCMSEIGRRKRRFREHGECACAKGGRVDQDFPCPGAAEEALQLVSYASTRTSEKMATRLQFIFQLQKQTQDGVDGAGIHVERAIAHALWNGRHYARCQT